jgi:beta-1,4-mannosyl-glycoprotein beta-1,4-N-acetylglucosaminyltransferase
VIERGLWRPFPFPSFRDDELYSADPDQFLRTLDQAEQDGDWSRAALLGEALARTTWPGPDRARRLARALAETGRPGEGLELLLEHADAFAGDADFPLELARAYAGQGRLEEAARALGADAGADPEGSRRFKVRKHILIAHKLACRLDGLRDWADFRLLSELLRGLGAVERAAEIVLRYLAGQIDPQPDQWDDILNAAQMALTALRPEESLAVVSHLTNLYPKSEGRAQLQAARRILKGEDPTQAGWRTAELGRHDRDLRFTAALAWLAGGKRTRALAELSAVAERLKKDREVRLVLARAVGEEVLDKVPVRYRSGGGRKIINLTVFNNERELLKLKLAEESSWVDHFVIVEANQTFTGLPKPLWFEEWKSEFADYADRITHVKVESFPDWAATAWARDFYQRDMGVAGASGLWAVDDLVLVTDADEIVDRRALEGFDGEYASMRMETFRFFLNHHMSRGPRPTGVVFRAKYFQRYGISYARFILRSSRALPSLGNCGWHFTSVSDAAGVAAKMQSYAHQENNRKDLAFFEALFGDIRRGKVDPEQWENWPIDERFPAYIRENQDLLASLILPEDLIEAVA